MGRERTDWITDRAPTELDADEDGDVSVRRSPVDDSNDVYVHYSMVSAGTQWKHTYLWVDEQESTPAEPAKSTEELDLIAFRGWWQSEGSKFVAGKHIAVREQFQTLCQIAWANAALMARRTTVFVQNPAPQQSEPRRFTGITRTNHRYLAHQTLDAIDQDGRAWWLVLGSDSAPEEWTELKPLPTREEMP